ncbi:MAG: hypothetical protein WKG52_01845 [Variovorax sp.]
MPLICDICGTLNRGNAMFCHGCTCRRSAFVASCPSALENLNVHAVPRPRGAARIALPAEAPAFWLRLCSFTLATSLAFLGWYFSR